MRIDTTQLAQARIVAGRVPCDATIRALVVDEIPPSALVQFMDGSYATFKAGWPTHCDQKTAHFAMHQSSAASHPRTVTEDHREKLIANLAKARAARAAKKKTVGS